MEYYTDLVWKRRVKEPMGWGQRPMKGMDDILKVPDAGKRGLNILIQGGCFVQFTYFCLGFVAESCIETLIF